MSGKPLEYRSNQLINKFYSLLKNNVKIIGVGGVDSGKSAYDKFSAGASYIQLYTGMVYEGPGIVKKIKTAVSDNTALKVVASKSHRDKKTDEYKDITTAVDKEGEYLSAEERKIRFKIKTGKISAEDIKRGTAVAGAEGAAKVAADTTGASALAIREP